MARLDANVYFDLLFQNQHLFFFVFFLLRIKDTRKNRGFMYMFIATNVLLTMVIVGLYIGICDPPSAYRVVGCRRRCVTRRQIMGCYCAGA